MSGVQSAGALVPFLAENGTTCYAVPMRNKDLRVKAKGAPPIVNGTTPPRRVANAAVRPREYLTPEEVERLTQAAGKGKECGHRDGTMILLAYRHGLRAGELVSVRWDQLDFRQGTFPVHPHMLRHACGFKLANDGADTRALQEWLG